jgi:hypothetical protein
VGPLAAGESRTQKFVVHAAPGAPKTAVSFAFSGGRPSDGSAAIPTSGAGAWTIGLPGRTKLGAGGEAAVSFTLKIPSSAPAGTYTGVVVASTDRGQTLRIPVFASVPLHDRNSKAGGTPGPQARIASKHDVFAKGDTTWPSVVGSPGTGSSADWLVYPVDLAPGLTTARFAAWDSDQGNETYDLYLYDARFDLIASTHPFLAAGVTDQQANNARGPSTAAAPAALTLMAPAAGRYYVAVSRARVGGTSVGDMGSFVLTLDEVR